jgi:hypothetical protein
MGHEASLIRADLLDDLCEFGRTAPVPLWVVQRFSDDFGTLGVYVRILSAAELADPEKMCVTVSKSWARELLEGDLREPMSRLLDVGAVTQVAAYRSGKVRFQIEEFPPRVRAELDSYRRPGGRLVAAF